MSLICSAYTRSFATVLFAALFVARDTQNHIRHSFLVTLRCPEPKYPKLVENGPMVSLPKQMGCVCSLILCVPLTKVCAKLHILTVDLELNSLAAVSAKAAKSPTPNALSGGKCFLVHFLIHALVCARSETSGCHKFP